MLERDQNELTFCEDPVNQRIDFHSNTVPVPRPGHSLKERKVVYLSVLQIFVQYSRNFSRFSPNFAVTPRRCSQGPLPVIYDALPRTTTTAGCFWHALTINLGIYI